MINNYYFQFTPTAKFAESALNVTENDIQKCIQTLDEQIDFVLISG